MWGPHSGQVQVFQFSPSFYVVGCSCGEGSGERKICIPVIPSGRQRRGRCKETIINIETNLRLRDSLTVAEQIIKLHS